MITPTANPLVALFSAPPCPEGSQFRVAFRREGDEEVMRTPSLRCNHRRATTFTLPGCVRKQTTGCAPKSATAATVKSGEWMSFRTGVLDGDFPVSLDPRAASATTRSSEPFLVHSAVAMTNLKRPFATDLMGEIVWYSLVPQMADSGSS